MFSSESYDHIFATEQQYKGHYSQSSYLPVWQAVAARIGNTAKIVDLGCGPGQFAQFLFDSGFTDYTGVDFSRVAIEKAKTIVPAFNFICADANRFIIPEKHLIVAIEFFEHIEDDRKLISRMPDTRLIFTVPSYTAPNHYRTYPDERFIHQYYRKTIEIRSIGSYRCKGSDYIFIVDSFTHRKP